MRILNRPMFRYGGPIKEGIMHGMKNGGRAALVGNPVYPKTDGREHHNILKTIFGWGAKPVLGAGASQATKGIKSLWQKYGPTWPKATRTGQLGEGKGAWEYGKGFKEIPIPKMERFGRFVKKNPYWTAGGVLYGGAPIVGATKAVVPSVAKRIADLAVPDWIYNWETGRWFNPDDTDLKPSDKKILAEKVAGLTSESKKPGRGDEGMYWKDPARLAAEAKAARTAKMEKYLDTMGYDKSKDTALSNALIDASAIVQEGTDEAGSLKDADWSKLINRAIQSTSKRLDKPDQIREAVGLMMTKADIAKDATADEDALNKLYKTMQIKVAQKGLRGNTLAESIQESFARNQKIPSGATLAGLARTHGVDAKVLPISEIPKDMSAIDYITIKIKESADKGTPLPEGNYVVKDRLIHVDETGTITDLINQ